MLLFLSNSSKYQAYQISKMNFSKNTARKSQRNVLQAPKSLLGQLLFFEKYRSFDPSKLNKDDLYGENPIHHFKYLMQYVEIGFLEKLVFNS